MTTVCTECGDEVGSTYDCRDCGAAFCVDCRLPEDHDCAAQVEHDGGADVGAAANEAAESFSLPSGPRVEALLPAWRAIPWQVHAVLSLVPFYIIFHIYHERLTGSEDPEGWVPSMGYYTPALLFLAALQVSTNVFALVLFGGLPTLITVIVYAVQKVRHA